MNKGFYISTDKEKLDIQLIHNYLSHVSYWAKGRDLETVKKSIQHSFCFGIYQGNEQVGFARVVTDFCIFAWLMDVFILESHRKQGLGKMLIDSIINHPELQGLTRWGLATEDAHGLYEQYGFKVIEKPELLMEKVISK